MRKVAIDSETAPGELHLTIDPDGPRPERVVLCANRALDEAVRKRLTEHTTVVRISTPSAVGKSEQMLAELARYNLAIGQTFTLTNSDFSATAARLAEPFDQTLVSRIAHTSEDDPKVKDLRRRISLARAKRDRRTETMLTKELSKIWGKS